MSDRECKRCNRGHRGRITCPHCKGSGGPGKRGQGVGGDKGRCALCLGTGTLECPACGGVGVLPDLLVIQ